MNQKRANKTALVLAGGGFTGAVYEIGALRAIDDLLIDLSVNDFDIYVGTSAGAFISAFLANGVSPEKMLSVMGGSNSQVEAIERQHIFQLNWNDYLHWGINLPGKVINAWYHYFRHFFHMSIFDLIWSMTQVMPNGFYDSLGLEKYIRQTLAKLGYSNNFSDLQRELYIIATDLDLGERAIFGPGYLDAPISLAAAASSAVPIVYKPVCIGDKEYIDGGMRGAASIDLAIERGANLVVCINPLVPFDYTSQALSEDSIDGSSHLSSKGIPSIAGQTLRIFSHAGLQYHIKQLRRAHPQVDIILIEPKPDDYHMFLDNIMHFSERMNVAHHGFDSITLNLAEDYQEYKEILARHGIRITRRLVIEELNKIEQSNHDPEVIRQVLVANRIGYRGLNPDSPIYQLSRILFDLDGILEHQITTKPLN